MTRENKLALIIGFGLVLLVGILVSDHFSAANSQPVDGPYSADTAGRDIGRLQNPELLVPRYARDLPAASQQDDASTTAANSSPEENGPAWIESIRMPDAETLIAQDPNPHIGNTVHPGNGEMDPERASGDFVWHTIRANENLAKICKEVYGDGRLWYKLYKYNSDRISDPDKVREGLLIRVPRRSVLTEGASSTEQATRSASGGDSAEAPPPAPVFSGNGRAHTVKDGETLSEIAQKYLGSARKYWTLYEYNKEVIDDPDNVQAGTVLRIPD